MDPVALWKAFPLLLAILQYKIAFAIGKVVPNNQSVSAGPEICQGKPADVIFVLDSSASISYVDFKKQLAFVQGVIEVFDMTPGMTAVASLSFSNWAFLDFNLNQFSDKIKVQEAIGEIRQLRGDTNTAAALAYMQDEMFKSEHGGRQSVPWVAIVLTDGKSNSPTDTAVEAVRARLKGIHTFAIGVGDDVDQRELKAIASQPTEKYVFKVDSYSSLAHIKSLLAIEACKVPEPPITTVASLTEQVCGNGNLIDIILGVPPTASLDNTNKALDFYQNWISSLDGVGDTVHVGMAPRECMSLPALGDQVYTNKQQLLQDIDLMLAAQPSTASTLHYMRREGFKSGQGGRKKAKKIGVIMVEEDDADLQKGRREAAKAKIMTGMDIHVISVGRNVTTDLNDLASSPDFVHSISRYEDLLQISSELRQSVCATRS